MSSSKASHKSALSPDEISVTLKTTVHFSSRGGSEDLAVAGAGVVIAVGENVQDYEIGKDVAVLIEESQGHETITVKAHIHACPMPSAMSYEDAASILHPFASGLVTLQEKLGIGFSPSSTSDRADDLPTTLILGGERALAQALTQLIHIASPTTSILVACRAEDTSTPKDFEEAVRPFCGRAVENGAKYGIDGAAPDLVEHLRAAIDEYGGPLKLILDVEGELVRRPDIMEMLHAGGKSVDCTREQFEIERIGNDGMYKVMETMEKLMVKGTVCPPLCTDMYVKTL